jgi:beta-amylase
MAPLRPISPSPSSTPRAVDSTQPAKLPRFSTSGAAAAPAPFEPSTSRVTGSSSSGSYTLNVMAPLLVGDPKDLDSPESQAAWTTFENQLIDAKKLGAESVSSDVWWGLIEPKDQAFDFRYYDRMAQAVENAGLKWVPILSFHQCGGNVGDDAYVPLPSWLGAKYQALDPSSGADALFAKSEQGNVSHESISPWGSEAALGEYEGVMRAFQRHFASKAGLISELNISLGPAGELRYPSYNSHDVGTDYPTRGALQAYSPLALESFRAFVEQKYGSVEAASQAWGLRLDSREQIRPPDDAAGFFQRHDQFSPYGRDFFDWYSESLQAHGKRILSKAIQVFDSPQAAFRGIDLGAKVPGIHWRMTSDRAPELAAGLLQTSDAREWNDDSSGHGYRELVDVFKDADHRPRAPNVVLHFTALEMDDGGGGPDVGSQARSLVFWVAKEAQEEGVTIKGENALSYTLKDPHAWENIEDALANGGYRGLTVLRVNDVVENPVAREGFQKLASEFE